MNALHLTPRPLYEEVAERLRQRIFARDLEPGSWIDEIRLAQEYGISRTPMREALTALGLHTIGALAALPPGDVEARWGADGVTAWRLAHGDDPRRPAGDHLPAGAEPGLLVFQGPPDMIAEFAQIGLGKVHPRPEERVQRGS